MPFPDHLDEGLIHSWLDGQLPPDEAAAAEAHVAVCESCAALVAEARGYMAGASRILGALDAGGPARVAGGGGASGATSPRPSVAPRPRPRRWMIPSAVAATLLVAVGTTLTVRNLEQSRETASLASSRPTADMAAPRESAATAPIPSVTSSPIQAPAEIAARGGATVAPVALPPVVSPTPREALEERARATANVTANEQTAVADAASEARQAKATTAAAPPAPSPGSRVAGALARRREAPSALPGADAVSASCFTVEGAPAGVAPSIVLDAEPDPTHAPGARLVRAGLIPGSGESTGFWEPLDDGRVRLTFSPRDGARAVVFALPALGDSAVAVPSEIGLAAGGQEARGRAATLVLHRIACAR